MKALFVCSAGRFRSKTAATIFQDDPRFTETRHAGIFESRMTEILLDEELVSWADIIFVMEFRHFKEIHRKFAEQMKSKKAIILDIPDVFDFMDDQLVRTLKGVVDWHFRLIEEDARHQAELQSIKS